MERAQDGGKGDGYKYEEEEEEEEEGNARVEGDEGRRKRGRAPYCPRHNACRTDPIFGDTHLSAVSGGGKEGGR